MKMLVEKLSAANHAYYQENAEIMSNMEYDTLYDELVQLEKDCGIHMAGSPTRKVGYEVVSGLKKATHEIPMLSLDKTKEIDELTAFLGDEQGLLSWKLDGLTIVLKYENGELKQALTRGNGEVGEDVTHNARVFRNLPLTTPFKGNFSLRGEAVISIPDFEKINEENKYKNPRNLCSGAVRQLNNEITAKRRVLFFAFGLISGGTEFEKKSDQLSWLEEQGFEMAYFERVSAETVAHAVALFKAKIPTATLMSDGLVLTYDNIAYSESLGATSKFPKDSLAFKWADDILETTLTQIEWNTSRTGLINPVAIFEPVEIEGTQVSRASLHNVSILRALALQKGDTITVYKANMIIPQVSENLSKVAGEYNPVEIPAHCPICRAPTALQGDTGTETLYCTGASCEAQKLRALSHFVSRDAMNIAGLSEQTLEKLIAANLLTDYLSIFSLKNSQNEICALEGFGKKSFDKLVNSIEAAKNATLPNFIYALGIRHVGLANAKLLCAYFNHDPQKITAACHENPSSLLDIKGFGDAITKSLHAYFSQEQNRTLFFDALSLMQFKDQPTPQNQPLANLTFVITGDTTRHKNRKELQSIIENHGGRVTSSVTAKTSFLLNNDKNSSSSKNKKAAQLNIPILTEDEFIARFFA
jgi:DNA ligase (NAD+)